MMTMKKTGLVVLAMLCVIAVCFTTGVDLAAMLGISTAAAKKAIDIIDCVSTIATIVSLVAIVVGAGAITTAIVATAKKMIAKYGKAFAATW